MLYIAIDIGVADQASLGTGTKVLGKMEEASFGAGAVIALHSTILPSTVMHVIHDPTPSTTLVMPAENVAHSDACDSSSRRPADVMR